MSVQNPYQSPREDLGASPLLESMETIVPARRGLRLINAVVDYFAVYGLAIVVGIIVLLVGGDDAMAVLDQLPDTIVGMPIVFGYYFVSELTTSRTLGKLFTGTMVVDEDGRKPTAGQIAGRSLCRLIPFEALTFLGPSTRGWHDRLPKTFVVKRQP